MTARITDYRDIPYELMTTAREWYDGGNSAMYAFCRERPVDPRRLLKETKEAVAANLNEKWSSRLAALEAFAAAAVLKAKTEGRLRAAIEACFEAGVEGWQVGRIAEEAIEVGQERVRAKADDAERNGAVKLP